MTAKQKAKHITDSIEKILTPTSGSSLDAAEPTPDGLGAWEGGIAHRSIDGSKAKPQRTGDTKNRPGIDYASKITHRQDRDFNEIHIEDGKVLLYNVKTDAWDIEGDSADIPYYDNGTELLGYNVKTGKWDVPMVVEEVYFDAEAIERNTIEELSGVNPEIAS